MWARGECANSADLQTPDRGGSRASEPFALKRVITTHKQVPASGLASTSLARAVVVQPGDPANDPSRRPGSLLELVDDLAALAVKLYRSGRLGSKCPGK